MIGNRGGSGPPFSLVMVWLQLSSKKIPALPGIVV